MREFFRDWKRKAGCVTLALALVVFATWMNVLTLPIRGPYLEGIQWVWRCHFAGLNIGVYHGHSKISDYRCDLGHDQSLAIDVPFWSIVLPLTLLTAYLLFSQPRLAKHRRPES